MALINRFSIFASALAVSTVAVTAATITVQDFDAADYAAAVGAGSYLVENFETPGNVAGEGEVGPDLVVDAGRFYSLGGTGSGGTVRNLAGNTGTELALRDGNTYGRRDTVGGRWYLDSNDTYGIGWQVGSTSMFDTVMFVLSDGSDTGAFLRISADGTDYEQRTNGRLRNGNAQLVTITFDQRVNSALIELANYNADGTALRRNDGFSIDGVQVGIAPVPLPSAGLLLAAGLGGLAMVRGRRGRAQA